LEANKRSRSSMTYHGSFKGVFGSIVVNCVPMSNSEKTQLAFQSLQSCFRVSTASQLYDRTYPFGATVADSPGGLSLILSLITATVYGSSLIMLGFWRIASSVAFPSPGNTALCSLRSSAATAGS
jgi:hypothetical protein